MAKKKLVSLVAAIGCLPPDSMRSRNPLNIKSLLYCSPVAINQLDALNRSKIYDLPPIEALNKVGGSLESYESRLGFFRANQKLFSRFERPGRSLEQSFEEFNRNSINLVLPDPKKADSLSAYIKLEMNYPEGDDGVSILNGFVDYVLSIERQKIAADINVIVKNRLHELLGKFDAARSSYGTEKEAKIASLHEADNLKRVQLNDELKALRVQLKTERADRVTPLNEAIGIAQSLGIRRPTTPTSLGQRERENTQVVMRTEVSNQQIPLYFMGTDALIAERAALALRKSDDFTAGQIAQIAKELQLLQTNREIDILAQRKNEDLFLNGVEPLHAEMARLRNLNIDISGLSLVTIDKQALEPLAPIKPKKTMILLLGLVVGVMLGIAFALIRHTTRSRSIGTVSSPALVSPLEASSKKPANTASERPGW